MTTLVDPLDRVVMDAQRAVQNIVPQLAHKVRVRVYTREDGSQHVGVDTGTLRQDEAEVVRRIVAYVARSRTAHEMGA